MPATIVEGNPGLADRLEARALRSLFLRAGGFKRFVKHFWPYVDPRPLIWNWHLDVLCDLIEALLRGVINRLLINIPPGHAKSIICSVLAHGWQWARKPDWRCIFGSHDESLALRDAVKARDLIKCDEYQRVFKPDWIFNPSQDTKHHYGIIPPKGREEEVKAGGQRYSTSVGGAVTGFRGDAVIVDDPLDANKTPSEVALKEHVDWFGNLASRIDDEVNSQWLVIMQRLCEGDLSDHLIEKGDWVHLRLPSEFDPEDACEIRNEAGEVVWRDPRTEHGEPLFPAYQPKVTLKRLRVYLGDARFEAQYNQRPVPPGGFIIKDDFVRWHKHPPAVIRARCADIVLSVDLTFMKSDAGQEKANSRRSFNNLDVWGTDLRNFYLIDNDNGRWSWDECKERLLGMVRRWKIWTVLLEEATVSGIVVSEMGGIFNEVIEIPPIGSKEARVQVTARYWRMGRVWLPDEEWARFWFSFIRKFPGTAFKDRADTMSQAINWWTAQGGYDDAAASAGDAYSQEITMKQHNPAGSMLARSKAWMT
jgi:predicted phage terminase large subunit-like protein